MQEKVTLTLVDHTWGGLKKLLEEGTRKRVPDHASVDIQMGRANIAGNLSSGQQAPTSFYLSWEEEDDGGQTE